AGTFFAAVALLAGLILSSFPAIKVTGSLTTITSRERVTIADSSPGGNLRLRGAWHSALGGVGDGFEAQRRLVVDIDTSLGGRLVGGARYRGWFRGRRSFWTYAHQRVRRLYVLVDPVENLGEGITQAVPLRFEVPCHALDIGGQFGPGRLQPGHLVAHLP